MCMCVGGPWGVPISWMNGDLHPETKTIQELLQSAVWVLDSLHDHYHIFKSIMLTPGFKDSKDYPRKEGLS